MNARLKRIGRNASRALFIVIVFFFLPVGCQLAAHFNGEPTPWWELRRDSSEQAPPATSKHAIIQVYAARAARWRGAFGVHTWVAYKRANENFYNRLEVIGYYAYYGNNAVRRRRGTPDAYWFGNRPTLLREITGGVAVDSMIDRLEAAADSYPYPRNYRVWPGPNSNTFVAWLAREVPELRLELPPHAIGKDYLPNGDIVGLTPSGLGAQVSFAGYFGLLVGLEEGLEINLLGLTLGVDAIPPAVKLPGVGRIGFDDVRRYQVPDTPEPN